MANLVKIYYSETGVDLSESNINIAKFRETFSARLVTPLLSDFAFEFNVFLETTLTEGNLVYTFHPFRNMIDEKLKIVDFSTKDLNFSINNPVDIEIQPSYDGTVNLILTDNLNPPRLINSRFSATEGKRYYVVDRFGAKDTNLYNYDKIDSQTKLYKTINKIPKLDFGGLSQDGKLPVGNYVFYFRLVDADDNETDIITESGIVSCHIGGINDPLSIRGGIGNENSGKSVSFKFSDLDSNYNFLNIYYSRSTSDYNGQEITTYRKINTKYTIKGNIFDFRITGYEPVEEITRDKINLQYNIIDRNKSTAQVQNRLFLANIHKTTPPFLELKDLSLRITPISNQPQDNIGFLNTDYTSIEPGQSAYYNASNIYNYTGYWDDEIYRLAIVYIMTDFSLSDPYNIRGADHVKKAKLGTDYTYYPVYDNNGNRFIIPPQEEDMFLSLKNNGQDFLENFKGVIRIHSPFPQIIQENERGNKIKPISINITIPQDVQKELTKYTRGFFIVRQKRIPTIISQGFSIGCDKISGLPLIPEYTGVETAHVIQGSTIYQSGYNGLTFNNPAYESIGHSLTEAVGKYRLPNKGEVYFTFISDKNMSDIAGTNIQGRVQKGGAMILPDLSVNMGELSQVFSGSDFTITSTRFAPITKGFTRFTKALFHSNKTLDELDQAATHFVIASYKETPSLEIKSDVMTLLCVDEDTTSVSYNNNYYSSRAGIPEEPWRFSAFLKEEIGLLSKSVASFPHNGAIYTYNQNALIRGRFMPFLGMSKKTPSNINSGEFYNIRTLGYSESNMKVFFTTRGSDNAPFMAVSDRYSWDNYNKLGGSLDIFRGDCFINQATIRVLRNFQDPELPSNDVVVNYKTLENFDGYAPVNEILELKFGTSIDQKAGTGIYSIIRSDVNANRLGYWVTLKFCSNINYAFRCVDPTFTTEQAIFGKPRGFFPLYGRSLAGNSKIAESSVINTGYNSTTSDKELFITPDVQAIKNDFTNRIMFSDIHVNDSTKNGYRIFEGLDYQDYTIENGTITKIVSWGNNLVVIFENGVGMVPINERTLAGTAEGGDVYTKGVGVLSEKPLMLSQTIGSSWRDSIKISENYIYGVDTTAKKIWRTNGEKFEVFSEFKIQKFLNDNLTFTVYDKTPSIGLKNVVTHYNGHKHDLMFTFYDQTFNEEEKVWNLCFNEQLNNWTTRYSWVPAFSENLDNTMFTFARGTCKVTSMISKSISSADGLGSIYLDSGATPSDPKEKYLTTNDYLSLFYEKKEEDNYAKQLDGTYTLSTEPSIINVAAGNTIEFLDSPYPGKHPMVDNEEYGVSYDKVSVITPTGSEILWVYSSLNERIAISSNSSLSFYASDNTTDSIVGDKLLKTLLSGDFINNTALTTTSQPNLKIKFHVDAVANKEEADLLVKEGWTFNIKGISSSTNLLDTTEYLLTLQGVEKYKHPTLKYTKVKTDTNLYDDQIFDIIYYQPTISNLSIKANAFSEDSAEIKYKKLLQILSRIYFSVLIDLQVFFNLVDTGTPLKGFDTFRDVVYTRPSSTVIEELLTIFRSSTPPPLKPATDYSAAIILTEDQKREIIETLVQTKNRYTAHTTTNLWKHGTSGIFGSETIASPAVWYDERHKFEFEFVVNGEELGIHKLFDNLKIISNKAEPESFEFEIIGDAYEFTKDNRISNTISAGDTLLKKNYALIEPARESFNNKTKERGIIVVQEPKNIKVHGLRKGNLQYKEDMWEVQIIPLKVAYKGLTTKILETKIRDKYCKIRVKYEGNQLAIITALQTIYTLSYS